MNTTTKTRPIICTAESVRAMLAGTKTQTRRTSNLEMVNERPDQFTHATSRDDGLTWDFWYGADSYVVQCPFGVPGDRLWVRETWGTVQMVTLIGDCPGERRDKVVYRAGRRVVASKNMVHDGRSRADQPGTGDDRDTPDNQ